ncbi:RagB/SusD family nutrient uptake outer membrane protein [Chitinophaga agrisoli]|uniref:RagB/SusD family nutrient uptake outer membrane protein n=1 Tax=Chitinophaga agrisoli TaxID=2607653 RepID=A0A5B2VNX0_9BACT|nr:RagB/SusD family nutrient uptake outer membrane protein [Chitinophaga agrisoli]KAA2240380.1 RagB/SusD family nutrient uptake outer membrane protein [Chitinophaga agrisoli]
MKKTNIRHIILVTSSLLLAGACSKSWLEPLPKGQIPEEKYYKTAAEAEAALTAVYDVVGWQGNGYVTKVGTVDAASDDHLAGGGGPNDVTDYQVISNYTLTPATGPQAELWKKGFAGIFRANTLLAKIEGISMDAGVKARYIAEAKALRAYFYFDLVRFFRNVPLMTAPVVAIDDMFNVAQAKPEEVYAQIEKDLKDALAETNLPDKVALATEAGRLSKGAVHALLGRVYVWEQKWPAAITELAEVNGATVGGSKYGYKLVDNFGDLFKSDMAHKFNSESVFEISYNSSSNGGWDCVNCTEGNVLNIMTGPRGYKILKPEQAPDYVSGWSFLVITKSLFDAIHGDPRYKYTVANLDSLEKNGIVTYEKGFNNTGYFMEKFAGRVANRSTGGTPELNYPQNIYEIRLADTYLLEAEALVRNGESGLAGTRSFTLFNAVRARVGLPAIPVTLDNILSERRLELAGEGHRWLDLVRFGKAATFLQSKGFIAGKHEVLPIPLLELENTKLEQNPEWK